MPGTYAVARCHVVLGKDAYRKGDLTTATTEFTAASQIAEADHHTTQTSDFGGPAQTGLAAVAARLGDLRGTLQAYLKAADLEAKSGDKAADLYLATEAADKLADTATRQQIIDRMISEVPGSSYTTKLVGHEVLPVREP